LPASLQSPLHANSDVLTGQGLDKEVANRYRSIVETYSLVSPRLQTVDLAMQARATVEGLPPRSMAWQRCPLSQVRYQCRNDEELRLDRALTENRDSGNHVIVSHARGRFFSFWFLGSKSSSQASNEGVMQLVDWPFSFSVIRATTTPPARSRRSGVEIVFTKRNRRFAMRRLSETCKPKWRGVQANSAHRIS